MPFFEHTHMKGQALKKTHTALRQVTLLWLTFLCAHSPAWATNAGLLLKSCNPEAHTADLQTFHRTGCIFFIRGVMDAHNTFVAVRRVKPIYCAPGDMTFAAVEHLYVNWMAINMDKQHWTAADAIYAALADFFPCDQGREKGPT